MKSLNQTLRTILLTLTIVSITINAFAYDFMVKGIYYNINGDEATVTYEYRSGYYNNGYLNYRYYNDNTGHVTIPETVTFNGMTYTVTAIGDHAFCHYNSDGITGITIPNTVTSIGESAFYACSGLTELIIPNSVVNIEGYAFDNCYRLTSVTMSDAVTYIGVGAFQNCTGLSKIVLPDAATTIDNYAFFNGSNLTSLTIGKSVSYIGSCAFGSCPQLKSVNCLGDVPPTVSNTDFFSDYTTPILYVPINSVEAYRTTYGWNYFTDVRGFGENYFMMPDITTMHGETLVIPVSMENVDEITAFQTDINLPQGFELLKDGDEYIVTLSDRKGRDHVIMVNDAPDGAIRVLSYSPTLKTFKNNEGELFYLTVKVPEDIEGTYQIELSNTILTTADEDELHALNALNDITVLSNIMIMGDADGSGEITVADVVQTARYILNYNPEPFIFELADINGDEKITITDVVKIAHLILDQDYDEPTQLHMMAPNMGGDHMNGEAVGNTVSINLANELEYTAMQMDLTLPEGMNASEFALTNRASELGLIVKDRGNGKVRVLAYSPNLKTIKGSEGAVLTFNVDGAMGEIMVDRIELVNLEGVAVRLDAFTIAANNPTALDEMNTGKTIASVKYFNLAGQEMTELTDGVNLVVTTYNDGTRTTSKVIR